MHNGCACASCPASPAELGALPWAGELHGKGWTALPPLPQVQQHCRHLERMLQGQVLPTPQWAQLRNEMATSPVRRQAQPSDKSPMAVASPRSRQ